ncbi:MAG: hypothetical protein MHM6MM_003476 [Cercozoa sp. M6MM]
MSGPMQMQPQMGMTGGEAVLCCLCGASMEPNAANMCARCLQDQVDVTEGITRQVTLFHCRDCSKFFKSPNWVLAELESRELMNLCLRKVKGLDKVRLVDASWIWTEPHSRRLKVKLTVQKEVMTGVVLQQSFSVEYVMTNQQCTDCQKSYTEHTWVASLQLRQRCDHKRTFLFLEQLILKHGVTDSVVGIKEVTQGLDFFFSSKSACLQMQDFINGIIPLKTKESKRLVSQDFSNNTTRYKYTLYAEMVPVCKDDLVVLPRKLAKRLGGVPQTMLCVRVSRDIHLLDPDTLTSTRVTSRNYWTHEFLPLCNVNHLSRFMVYSVEPTGHGKNAQRLGKFLLADVELVREDDYGMPDAQVCSLCVPREFSLRSCYRLVSWQIFAARTHLGHILHEGDIVLCYDLTSRNFNSTDADDLQQRGQLPEIVVVKKHYEKRRKRKWHLRRLAMERDAADDARRKGQRAAMLESELERRDREHFLRDLEEDSDMRNMVNVYRDETGAETDADMADDEADGSNDVAPAIPIEEMLASVSI